MKNIIISSLLTLFIVIDALFAQGKNLSLEESKELAFRNNYSAKNSRLEIEASRQVKKSVFTNFFPGISAGGAAFRANENMMEIKTEGGNLPVYDGNPINLFTPTQFAYLPGSTMGLLKKGTFGAVNAVQPVFMGGRIYNGYKLAGVGEEVSELKDKLARNEINIKTEEQYWRLVSLDEKMKTITKYEELLRRLLLQVEDAYKSGVVMKNDLLKVKLKLSEVLLNRSRLDNGRKLAAMAFCQYIGVPYDSTLVLTDKLTAPDLPETYYIDKDQAVKKRTEYALLEKSVEAEHLQTKLKLGEYLPQAAVGASGIYMKIDENKSNSLGMIFGMVQVPISGWWGGSHTLQERSVKEEIAQNNFKNNSELLLLQIEKSWQDLTDAYKQYMLSEESLKQAEENLSVNNDSYTNGLINVSDLLEAQAMQQQSQDQLTEAESNYIIKKTAYLQSTGR